MDPDSAMSIRSMGTDNRCSGLCGILFVSELYIFNRETRSRVSVRCSSLEIPLRRFRFL